MKKGQKTKKQTKMSIAQCFFQCAKIGTKNKQELIKSMLELLNKLNIKVTQKGTAINEQVCKRQVNAIIRDIRKKRGKLWSQYKVVENENQFCIVIL